MFVGWMGKKAIEHDVGESYGGGRVENELDETGAKCKLDIENIFGSSGWRR